MPFYKHTIENTQRRVIELEETVLTLAEELKSLSEQLAFHYPANNRQARFAFVSRKHIRIDARTQEHVPVANLMVISNETAESLETIMDATEFQKDTTKPDDEQMRAGRWQHINDVDLLDDIIRKFTRPDCIR